MCSGVSGALSAAAMPINWFVVNWGNVPDDDDDVSWVCVAVGDDAVIELA